MRRTTAIRACSCTAVCAHPVESRPIWLMHQYFVSCTLLPTCRPTELQLRLYSSVLGSGVVRKMLSATGSDFGDTVSGEG